MFSKKPKKQTEQPQQNGEFQKNIKVLWLYTSLFCAFALVLIVLSSVIQGKIDKNKDEYYQSQFENLQTSSQSTIKNIKDENTALKADIKIYKEKADAAEQLLESEQQLVITANEMLENAQYLLDAQNSVFRGAYKSAREQLANIDTQYLTEQMKQTYDSLAKKAGL